MEDLYCEDNGRPSVDPVVLFKIVLIRHLYGIPSLRRTSLPHIPWDTSFALMMIVWIAIKLPYD